MAFVDRRQSLKSSKKTLYAAPLKHLIVRYTIDSTIQDTPDSSTIQTVRLARQFDDQEQCTVYGTMYHTYDVLYHTMFYTSSHWYRPAQSSRFSKINFIFVLQGCIQLIFCSLVIWIPSDPFRSFQIPSERYFGYLRIPFDTMSFFPVCSFGNPRIPHKLFGWSQTV